MAMMISKFHKIIQSKIVWTVFAILISVAFVSVYTGGKSASQSDAQRGSDIAGRLYGEEVTREEFGRAYRNIYLMVSMYSMLDQRINMTEEQVYQAAWQRLASLKKAAQLGLTATPEQTVEAIRNFPLFLNQQTGQFDQNMYNVLLSRAQLDPKSFETMFYENLLIDKVTQQSTQGALVTEEEIKERFHLYTDKLTVEYAALPRSLAETPEVAEEEAKAYFEQNQEQFRFPEKAIVHYVEFAVAEYTNTVSATDEMVQAFYENNKQRYLKPAAPDAPAGAEPEYQPLEEVKDSIAQTMVQALAQREAVGAADMMVAQLADESTSFELAAEKSGRTIVSNLPAFSATDRVKAIDPTAPFVRAAFALEKDAAHYYSDPVVGREKVYVLSLVKKLDSWAPGFDLVKEEAMESAKVAAAERAYVEKAEAVHQAVEADIQGGTSFADALAKHGLNAAATVSFDASTSLEDPYGRELQVATIRLQAGELAGLVPTADEFLVAYVAGKEAGDEVAELSAMREELSAEIRREKAGLLATAWRESLLEDAGFEDLLEKRNEETESES
jgi:hypothetical protein